ncbi:related to pre-mRNA splicing factor U2AF large chain [Serendipita indica DSM 11827]|uniref:Related to pre-mRNA splicing factor U2AF large chain n=1 Tax=Serendipita indica (strain DSM 11827) TaxID=1109443 RepID=G4TL72_SERID|nr:related to pre-mRNA splicing factor U2AF large chain [Serendipita indica DSM 11827]
MQAKQTGLFNLPGANRSHGPQIIGFTGAHPPVATGMVSNSNLARQSRRLYLGSITPLADEESIALFFNSQMRERKLTTSSAPPVLAVQVNREKNYAFVEFRSAEDATAGMALDGTVFLDGPLRVRRPHDYAGPEAMTGVAGFATLLPATMPDSVNKIFIGNLPTHLTEDQIVELLKSFGELKAFNLVREHGTNVSKVFTVRITLSMNLTGSQGFAFVEYADPAVTDIATESLNGMDLGDKKLVVQRASVGAKGGVPIPPEAMDIPAPIVAVDLNKEANGRVVLMLNMVVAEDLMDDVEYEEILDDIRSECSGFGQVLGVYVPRPLKKDKSRWDTMDPNTMSPAEIAKADEIAGVGRVYVKFSDTEGATTAVRQLAGRSFAGRTIITTLMREDDPDVQRVFPNA